MGVMSKSQVRAAIGLDDAATHEQIERERQQDAEAAAKYGPANPPQPGQADPGQPEPPNGAPPSGIPTPPQPDRP
jgi:hypothetical protein